MAGTAASKARRVSSVGSLDSGRTLPRPSLPSALASTSNGISRARRGSSADRWRSPPMTCTPPEWKGERSFTPGQARRMNMGGNLGASPQGIASAGVDKSRRMTIGSVGGQGPRRLHGRQSLALR